MFFLLALTLLVGWQEGHPACKKLGVGLLLVMIWQERCTSARLIAPVVINTSIIPCFILTVFTWKNGLWNGERICVFILPVGHSVLVVSTSANDWPERLVSEMTCNMLMGDVKTSPFLFLHSFVPMYTLTHAVHRFRTDLNFPCHS